MGFHEKLFGNSECSVVEIRNTHQSYFMIHKKLYTGSWKGSGKDKSNSFLRLPNAIPWQRKDME